MSEAGRGNSSAAASWEATKLFEDVAEASNHAVVLLLSDKSLLPPNQSSRIIGTVALSFHPDTMQPCPSLAPPAGQAYLSNMSVDAKFRRCGHI